MLMHILLVSYLIFLINKSLSLKQGQGGVSLYFSEEEAKFWKSSQEKRIFCKVNEGVQKGTPYLSITVTYKLLSPPESFQGSFSVFEQYQIH